MTSNTQILSVASIQTKLTREQKEVVGILSFGTFLEYFDLMLYVHMAVLLNELFFPKTDPLMSQFLTAATFCTTYVFRPFGALLIGWIGDTMGRRYTVILTGFVMAGCCVVMATAPTYAEVGLAASVIMMLCRIVQGMTSMGEVVGALLYLTETLRPPVRYRAVALIPMFCAFGALVALGISNLILSNPNANWRWVFVFGAFVAGFGFAARSTLRETKDFLEHIVHKQQEKKEIGFFDKSSISLFFMECAWPICFYISTVYCGDLLRFKFGYTAVEVVRQNFYVNLSMPILAIITYFLMYIIHPLLMLRYKLVASLILYAISPFWIERMSSGFEVGIFQTLILVTAADSKVASSAIYNHFAVLRRFRVTSFLYALSRAVIYIITSFGLVYLNTLIGSWGACISLFVAYFMSHYGLKHFMKLEKEVGNIK